MIKNKIEFDMEINREEFHKERLESYNSLGLKSPLLYDIKFSMIKVRSFREEGGICYLVGEVADFHRYIYDVEARWEKKKENASITTPCGMYFDVTLHELINFGASIYITKSDVPYSFSRHGVVCGLTVNSTVVDLFRKRHMEKVQNSIV